MLPQTLRKYAPHAITVDDYVQSADEKKIRSVFETMQKAWAGSDDKTFGSCFTEDSDFVSFLGDHYKGRESNVAAHRKLFNGALKNTSLYVNIKSIRFLNEEMAVVHAEGTVLKEFESVSNSCKLSYTTNILVKEKGEWKITSFHNSKKQKTGIVTSVMNWFNKRYKM
jgi:uncharacterized protein (TIGR02246 family)